MRKPLIAGNWKMNLGHREAVRLADGLKAGIDVPPDRDCAVFPSFTSLHVVAERLRDTSIRVGAQNCWHAPEGAVTGEVACTQLKAAGATLVLVGHSERRHVIGETDALVNLKVKACLKNGLTPLLCVGETLAQRDGGETSAVVLGQVRAGLGGIEADQLRDVIIAYEPVWAIGTGRTATPAQAEEVHALIRKELATLLGPAVASETRILYGGSVKPNNVDALLAEPDVDGALVGGASLDEADFHRIVWFETTRKN